MVHPDFGRSVNAPKTLLIRTVRFFRPPYGPEIICVSFVASASDKKKNTNCDRALVLSLANRGSTPLYGPKTFF
jgi:hypothetical protein